MVQSKSSATKFLPSFSVLVVITALASVAFWSGVTPWILYLELIVLCTLALSTWMRPTLAIASSMLGTFALYSVSLPLFTYIPGTFSTKIYLLVMSIIVASAVFVLKNNHDFGLVHFHKLVSSNKVFFFTSGLLVIAFIIQCFASPHYSFWAMNNDAVWNTVSARFLISDGGLLGSLHPNASPLTAGILAAATSPGRELVPSVYLLSHDISLQAQAWGAVIMLSSLFAGIAATIELAKVNGFTKWVGIIGAMSLPLTWYYSGFAARFGFYNASLATLVLLAIWIVWQVHHSEPVFSVLALCLGSVVLLATWAPLVLVPGFLLVYILVTKREQIWKQKSGLIISVIGLIILGGYALLITLKDLTVQGGALSVDGGIFDYQLTQFVLILVSALLVALLATTSFNKNHTLIGVALVLAAAIIGLGFLAFQRRNAESMWGYYPIKFGWLISTLLLEIILISLLGLVSRYSFSVAKKAIFVMVSGGFVILLMALSGLVAPKNIFTPISVTMEPTASLKNQFLQELSALAIVGQQNMVVGFGASPEQDLAFNNWLLQVNADSSEEPIRWFSYYLDGTDLQMVCDATNKWGEGINIHTKNPSLADSLQQVCPNIPAKVIVHG